MANLPISALTDGAPLETSDLFVIARAGSNFKIAADDIFPSAFDENAITLFSATFGNLKQAEIIIETDTISSLTGQLVLKAENTDQVRIALGASSEFYISDYSGVLTATAGLVSATDSLTLSALTLGSLTGVLVGTAGVVSATTNPSLTGITFPQDDTTITVGDGNGDTNLDIGFNTASSGDNQHIALFRTSTPASGSLVGLSIYVPNSTTNVQHRFTAQTPNTTFVNAISGSFIVGATTAPGGSQKFQVSGSAYISSILTVDALNLGNPLSVANGGTAATSLTGIIIGNGTGAMTGIATTPGAVIVGASSDSVTNLGPPGAASILTSDSGITTFSTALNNNFTFNGNLTSYAFNWVMRWAWVDSKAQDTPGGSSAADTWNVRTIQTAVATNASTNITLSGNVFTIQNGTYFVRFSAPAKEVDKHQTRLRDTTNSVNLVLGQIQYADDTNSVQNISTGFGQFTISNGPITAQFQHWTELAVASTGLGQNDTQGNTGVNAIFGMIEFWQLA
jgi:hypothetical protein